MYISFLDSGAQTKIMEATCLNCNDVFVKKGKDFNRNSVFKPMKRSTSTPAAVIKDVYKSVLFSPGSSKFLCQSCCTCLTRIANSRSTLEQSVSKFSHSCQNGSYLSKKFKANSPLKFSPECKRRKIISTPVKTRDQRKTCGKSKQKKGRNDMQRKAASYLNRSLYTPLFSLLLKNSLPARRAFYRLVTDTVRKEVQELVGPNSHCVLRTRTSNDDIFKFTWSKLTSQCKESLPCLFASLVGACTTRMHEKTLTKGRKKTISVEPTLGLIFSAICYLRKPKDMKILQQLIGLQLWVSGCKREAFSRLNKLSLCQTIQSVHRTIDKLRVNFNCDVKEWRDGLSSSTCKTLTGEQDTPPARRQLFSDTLSQDFGYSLCFDNVNQRSKVRHHTKDGRGNRMLNLVQTYAAKDRIPCMEMDDSKPQLPDVCDVCNYLPNTSDAEILEMEFQVMIGRILITHIPWLSHLKEYVQWHIPHKYTRESNQKSTLIPLGVLHKDEAKIADMIDILDEYHKEYVPLYGHDRPVPTVLHGDGLSCERVNDAQNARCNAGNSLARLEGVEPNIQEWHKRALQLQDTFDELYKASSARSKGTLYYAKNIFAHRNVKADVIKCFNHASELMGFVTESYVVAAACQLTNRTLGCPAEDFTEQEFKSLVKDITDLAFHPPDSNPVLQSSVPDILKDDDSIYCCCHREIPSTIMIQCSLNSKCYKDIWYHITCINMAEEDIPHPDEPWYCSDDCKQHAQYGSSKKRNVTDQSIDYKFEYSKGILWRGLSDMVRADAVRENDGERMISHWKHDLIEFAEKHHPKYFIFGHRLLSNVNGCVSRRLQHQLIWNRTVNPSGKPGKNIEMDLQMEFFNRSYKESTKTVGGQLSDETIARHSQMVRFGKLVTHVFDAEVAQRRTDKRSHGKVNRSQDINELVDTLLNEKLLVEIPGRSHSGFPDYLSKTIIKFPHRLKNRILTKYNIYRKQKERSSN